MSNQILNAKTLLRDGSSQNQALIWISEMAFKVKTGEMSCVDVDFQWHYRPNGFYLKVQCWMKFGRSACILKECHLNSALCFLLLLDSRVYSGQAKPRWASQECESHTKAVLLNCSSSKYYLSLSMKFAHRQCIHNMENEVLFPAGSTWVFTKTLIQSAVTEA